MKFIIAILAFLNGGYMLLDGIYVMMKGKYIGPPNPGPWSYIFENAGINIYNLGPLFIIFGVAWLGWLLAFLNKANWRFTAGYLLCVLTLWYLPAGTAISVLLAILLYRYNKAGSG